MAKFIQIAIISKDRKARDYASELEDDFFLHFGDSRYHLDVRTFTIDEINGCPDSKDYVKRSIAISIYDKDSIELYKFMTKNPEFTEFPLNEDENIYGVSSKIMLKYYGVPTGKDRHFWRPMRFYYVEENFFCLREPSN